MRTSCFALVLLVTIGCTSAAPPQPARPCPPVAAVAPAATVTPPDPTLRGYGHGKTINQIITMTFKPEHEQEFLDLAAATVKKVYETQPGVLTYVLTKHPTEPHTYLWIERYLDADAAKAHGSAPYFDGVFPKLKLWWAKAPTSLRLVQILPP